MDALAESLAHLASQGRLQFLVTLLYRLGMESRGSYVEAGNNIEEAVTELRCENELKLAIADQLRSGFIGDLVYPDYEFMSILKEKSQIQGCANCFRRALGGHWKNLELDKSGNDIFVVFQWLGGLNR